VAALAASRASSATLCAGLGSAPFFAFSAARRVVVSMLGCTSAEWSVVLPPSIGFMAGNFAVSRLTGRFGIDA
jgi:hypothetical protein